MRLLTVDHSNLMLSDGKSLIKEHLVGLPLIMKKLTTTAKKNLSLCIM
jgi:hypothetical protein